MIHPPARHATARARPVGRKSGGANATPQPRHRMKNPPSLTATRRGGCWQYSLCAPPPLASDSRGRPCADLEKKESLELQPTQEPTAFRLALWCGPTKASGATRSAAERCRLHAGLGRFMNLRCEQGDVAPMLAILRQFGIVPPSSSKSHSEVVTGGIYPIGYGLSSRPSRAGKLDGALGLPRLFPEFRKT